MASEQPSDDPAISSRLDAVGPFAFHRPSFFWRWTGLPSEIEWDKPAGFENDLAPITVSLWFPSKRVPAEKSLPPLLDAMDQFRGRLAELIAALRTYLIDGFRTTIENQLLDWEKEQMADASGAISDAAILREVRSISLRFDATGKMLHRTAWLDVGWDEEHGLDIEWDAEWEVVDDAMHPRPPT